MAGLLCTSDLQLGLQAFSLVTAHHVRLSHQCHGVCRAITSLRRVRGFRGDQLAAATLAAASDWADPYTLERKRLVPEAPDGMFWPQRGVAQRSYSAAELESALQQLEAAGLPPQSAATIWLTGGSDALGTVSQLSAGPSFVDIMRQMLAAGVTAPQLEDLVMLSGRIHDQYFPGSLALLEALLCNSGGWHAALQAVKADTLLLYLCYGSPQPVLQECRQLALLLGLNGDEALALAKALSSMKLEVSMAGLQALGLLLGDQRAAVEAASAEPALLSICVSEPAVDTYAQLGALGLDRELLLKLARGLCWAARQEDALAGLHCLAAQMDGLGAAAQAAAANPSLLLPPHNQEVPEAVDAVQTAAPAVPSPPPPSRTSWHPAWEEVYGELVQAGLPYLQLEHLDDLATSPAGQGLMESLTLLQEVLGGWRVAAQAVLQDPFLTAQLALPVLVKEQCLRTKARGAKREQLVALVRKAKKRGY